MAGAVSRRAGALGDAFAEVGGHAAEGALVDLAVLGAAERHAVVLEFENGRHRLAHHVLDGVLVPQPVGALDGSVPMPAPVVLAPLAEPGGAADRPRPGMAVG